MLVAPSPRAGKVRGYTPAILAAVALLSISLIGFASARKQVTLVVDGNSRVVTTFSSSVGALLEQEKVELQEGDVVVPDPKAKLTRGMTVTVNRAVPVTVRVAGSAWTARTPQKTVGEALAALGVVVGPKDKVVPAPAEPVRAGQEIILVQVREEIEKRQVVIPYKVQRREDSDLPRGQTKVVQAGQNGLLERDVQLTFEDGRLVREKVIAERTLRQPVTEIVAVGTLGTISRGGREYRYTRVIEMVATAYCPTDKGGDFTALGLPARRGIVAVDPRVIPLGTNLYVDGYGPALAGDTGSAIRGNRIDLFLDSHHEAVNFGRRRVRVYVLKER